MVQRDAETGPLELAASGLSGAGERVLREALRRIAGDSPDAWSRIVASTALSRPPAGAKTKTFKEVEYLRAALAEKYAALRGLAEVVMDQIDSPETQEEQVMWEKARAVIRVAIRMGKEP